MGLFDNLFKNNRKTSLEKFEAIKAFVKNKSKFLMNDDFNDLTPDLVARKAIYKEIDKKIRENLTPEQAKEYDKVEERKNVLEMLKQELSSGRITENEFKEIFESIEFKRYMDG